MPDPAVVRRLNQGGWDLRVEERDIWTLPVSTDEVARARQGDWQVRLTPCRPVPRDWIGTVADRDVLCLASGGGQQAPLFAAANARVTVLDASRRQLDQDAMVAARDGLDITLVQGFMHDLSAFDDDSFDLVFHPASNCFAPEIGAVWAECARVLRPGGALLSGFMNPHVYLFDAAAHDSGTLVVRHRLPFAEIDDLPEQELDALIARDHVVEFSHSLETQIGGQCTAGLLIAGFYEDTDLPEWNTLRSRFMPTLFATRAMKP